MNIYQKEFSQLKPNDPIQFSETIKEGYEFIVTSGHGYLVVPKADCNSSLASEMCKYGFKGQHATYLEEDCEVPDFINAIS